MHIFKRRQKSASDNGKRNSSAVRWAAAGTRLTFRAELMPGRESIERTFEVARILDSGRVELIGLAGQHTETEFEGTH
jgi:HD superfamily phosphodiesterase